MLHRVVGQRRRTLIEQVESLEAQSRETDAQVAALLAAGWSPAPRVGVWIDASASDRRMWWERALELAAADRARNAGTA